MKFLISSLILILGFAAQAVEPTLITGRFEYKGSYTNLSREHFEFVYAKTEAARKQLQDLRESGYTCIAKHDDNWICRKILEVDPNDAYVASRVAKRFDGMKVFFSEVLGLDMIVDTDSYKVWKAHQKVTIVTKDEPEMRIFDSVQYAWTPGETKAYPGTNEGNPRHDMFNPMENATGVLWDFNHQPNRFQMDTYSVFVTLPKAE